MVDSLRADPSILKYCKQTRCKHNRTPNALYPIIILVTYQQLHQQLHTRTYNVENNLWSNLRVNALKNIVIHKQSDGRDRQGVLGSWVGTRREFYGNFYHTYCSNLVFYGHSGDFRQTCLCFYYACGNIRHTAYGNNPHTVLTDFHTVL